VSPDNGAEKKAGAGRERRRCASAGRGELNRERRVHDGVLVAREGFTARRRKFLGRLGFWRARTVLAEKKKGFGGDDALAPFFSAKNSSDLKKKKTFSDRRWRWRRSLKSGGRR